MNQAEYLDIMNAIEKLEDREKQLCDSYCKLNPQDKANRERDRTTYLIALYQVRDKIRRIANFVFL